MPVLDDHGEVILLVHRVAEVTEWMQVRTQRQQAVVPTLEEADSDLYARAQELHAAWMRASADVDNFWAAMRSQRTIGQVVGMLMAKMQLTAEDAFALLVMESQHRNVKLRDIADEHLDRHARTTPPRQTQPLPGTARNPESWCRSGHRRIRRCVLSGHARGAVPRQNTIRTAAGTPTPTSPHWPPWTRRSASARGSSRKGARPPTRTFTSAGPGVAIGCGWPGGHVGPCGPSAAGFRGRSRAPHTPQKSEPARPRAGESDASAREPGGARRGSAPGAAGGLLDRSGHAGT